MVDIETLGLEPGVAVLSIGACRFTTDGVEPVGFYVEIDVESCVAHGLRIDEDTMDWWNENHAEIAPLDGDVSLPDALKKFNDYLRPRMDEIWANSPSFDCAILEAAYDAAGIDCPWEFYMTRDVRTVRSLPCAVEHTHDGTEHVAIDDARHQAKIVGDTIAAAERIGGSP